MDTKWKNISYSPGLKIAAAVLLWLSLVGAFADGLFVLYNHDTLNGKSYFDTGEFQTEYARLLHDTVKYHIQMKSEENIMASKAAENVTRENLNLFRQIGSRISGMVNFAYVIKNQETGEKRYSLFDLLFWILAFQPR